MPKNREGRASQRRIGEIPLFPIRLSLVTCSLEMLLFWIIFNAIVVLLLLIDLAFVNRGGRVLSFRQSLFYSAIWIVLTLAFAVFIHQWMGPTKSLEFITGYLVEEALSVDNLFVFIVLFRYFKVPAEQERTVLFWGILGALVMRAAFILLGVSLVKRFEWILYLLGVFLVYTGFQLMWKGKDEQVDPSRNFALRLVRKFLPVTEDFEGNRFAVVRDGRRFVTPLFIVLLVVETTDILFATDSIPAILAITRDSFIVYTSNVFAILGLRSLFFALASLIKLFHYLNYGLAVVLMFIGAKMLVAAKYMIPTWVTLVVVAAALASSVIVSVLRPEKSVSDQ
jgi:tellurite resistance protein TerC